MLFVFVSVENLLSKITRYFGEASTSAPLKDRMHFSNYELYDSQPYRFTSPFAESKQYSEKSAEHSSHKDPCTQVHHSFSSLFSAYEFENAERNSTENRIPSFARETFLDSIVFKLLGGSRGKNGDNSQKVPQLTSGEMTNRFRKAIVIAVNYSLYCGTFIRLCWLERSLPFRFYD